VSELSCLPYAVGHGHEGVCLNLQLGSHRVLLDCGTHWPQQSAMAAAPADWVICTHAHPDHGAGLLEFHHAWPQIPIFTSAATAALLPLNWPEVPEAARPDFCQRLPWRQAFQLAPDLTVTLWPAGHLPGAACALLTYTHRDSSEGSARDPRTYTVFYTGDFFLSNARLVEGLPLDELRGLKPNVLIVEGSQGTARHPHRRQQENRLADQINQAIAAGHNVLLPVPILGLGQELVMLLRSHHHFTGRDLTVWVDAWVAQGCDAYLNLLPHLPTNVQNFARHQPLFWDERILPRVRRLAPDQPLSDPETPAIVIGYQEADLSRYGAWGDRPWRILLPEALADWVMAAGFDASPEQAPNPTLDWLQALAPHFEAGRATLDTYLLTTHCDGPGTTQLIHNLRPQHVVLVHGSPSYLMDLASLEDLQSRYQLHVPSPGQRVELPIGDRFLQPDAPETMFEGEMVVVKDGVQLILPDTLKDDPRWERLIDTGIVQLRWQGDDLVLRGLSQQNLLRQPPAPPDRRDRRDRKSS
jgi:Cft2 family RNA processing exonuclease